MEINPQIPVRYNFFYPRIPQIADRNLISGVDKVNYPCVIGISKAALLFSFFHVEITGVSELTFLLVDGVGVEARNHLYVPLCIPLPPSHF